MKRVKFSIYQLPLSNNGIFRDYRPGVTLDDYCCVYVGTMSTTTNNENNMCEDIYYTFNVDRPETFGGHSLSVSDVIAISDIEEESYTYWYCDPRGFIKFNPERY